jgi:hypothetical protein
MAHPHPPSSPKPRSTSPHHLPLAHQLGVELAPIKREIDIEVNAVESALRRIHPLKILFEVLPREIARQSHDFLDAGVSGIF